MSVTSIFLTNLPGWITEEELKHQLKTFHPLVFATPYEDTEIDCQLFDTSHTRPPCAIVSGLDYNFEKMLFETRGLEITHNYSTVLGIKPYLGEKTLPNGYPTHSISASYKREFMGRVGIRHKQISKIFNPSFWASVNVDGDKQHIPLIRIDKPQNKIKMDLLKSMGGLKYCRGEEPMDTETRIVFHSILEQIQAIAKLNLNRDFMMDPLSLILPRFTSFNFINGQEATISSCLGLGKEGNIVDIQDIVQKQGFVPFSALNENLFNMDFLKNLSSHCWRCKYSFELIGLNLHLTCLVARCKCNTDEYGNYDGYHWLGEDFTRLIVDHKKNGDYRLEILHYPVKQIYKYPEQYRQVVMPLLEEEWFFYSLQFGKANKTTAVVTLKKLIETIRVDKTEETLNLLAIQVLVPYGKVWTPENKSCITRVTLNWANLSAEAEICRMRSAPDDKVQIILRLKVPEFYPMIQLKDSVEIIPQPPKDEYNSISNALSSWVENPATCHSLRQVLLDPGRSPNKDGWGKDEIICDEVGADLQSLVGLMRTLDPIQKCAVQMAARYSASVIHGPPGTGTTYCVAALALWLAEKEEGVVVIATPTNSAADCVASTLYNIMSSFSIQQTVLRIYSATEVHRFLDVGNGAFDTLHEEIRKIPQWLNDDDLPEMEIIKTKINAGRSFLLTENQAKNLAQHEKDIENAIIRRYKIFISSFDSLSNKLAGFAQGNMITTVIIDEAGQVNQPSTLIPLQLNPKRLVLAGDHLQIPPTVMSSAASAAGLHVSMMDLLSTMEIDIISSKSIYPCPPPWTTLVVQYRMSPPILEFVSKLSYDGKLCGSKLVWNRPVDSSMQFLMKPMDGKRVGILNHKGLESVSRNGYGLYNDAEVEVIANVTKFFKAQGIPLEKITILTFYEEQRSRLFAKLDKEIDVRNVDAFQGRQNAIIIVSFVRGDPTSQPDIGYLANLNQINVAISRAQQFLFLACNYQFFRRSQLQHIQKFCRLAEKVGKIL